MRLFLLTLLFTTLAACAEPAESVMGFFFDHDTTGTVGRQINSVYEADLRMIDGRCDNGTISPDCQRIFEVGVQ